MEEVSMAAVPSVTMVSQQEATVWVQPKEKRPRLPAEDVKFSGAWAPAQQRGTRDFQQNSRLSGSLSTTAEGFSTSVGSSDWPIAAAFILCFQGVKAPGCVRGCVCVCVCAVSTCGVYPIAKETLLVLYTTYRAFRHMVGFSGCPAQGQELDLMILVDPFQLSILYDSLFSQELSSSWKCVLIFFPYFPGGTES